MRARGALAAIVSLAVLALPAPAGAATPQQVKAVSDGLAQAVHEFRLPAAKAALYRSIFARAVDVQRRLPNPRAAHMAAVISDVAAQSARYDAPRALALFAMLDFNTRHFGSRAAPAAGTDFQDADGVVYRAWSGRGLQFHPLANFAKLNSLVAARRQEEAQRLAEALLARAVVVDGGIVWEYYFPFGSGVAPWTSGMAQAVAAQALSRAGLPVEGSLAAGVLRRGLMMRVDGHEFVRLYSFSRLAVLNAQLQTLLSLRDYAALAEDPAAADLSARLEAATVALLPSFDTGAWSLYAHRGSDASLGYHTYVISLLKRLAVRSADPLWRATTERFERYTREPPVVTPLTRAFPALYPLPVDGFRDEARLELALSKLATITVEVTGRRQSRWFTGGRRTFVWRPAGVPPGLYPAKLRAVDPAGNAVEVELPTIEIRSDSTPPEITTARLANGVVTWRVRDAETPWVRVRVELQGAQGDRSVEFGRRQQSGWARLRVPKGRWQATLVVSDSSGNSTRVRLGLAVGR